MGWAARQVSLRGSLGLRGGDMVRRRDLALRVWDGSCDPQSNVIDVDVQRARRKVDTPGQPSLIRARRGEGYQLVAGPEAAA